ncbi:iron-sulfur cluster assembly [Stylonychia lemnae]|uniref:Iron-sulfur cluster assembly n=1 Tax=Stylonychia lemnae TaxID=5949 RepID=A0A077ZZ95_STYLE|nr:iron-sulfur cluster assembly [Stylonychia lemnae]|eukprot:CDW74907.1 iron-sulfur cluster assembly [Stylonychia lemnae]
MRKLISVFNFSTIAQANQAAKPLRQKKAALLITDQAASRIKELMEVKEDQEDIYGVKIDVRRRGCNGYSYVMDYLKKDQITRLDEVVEDKGVRVVVDKKALMFVVGTEMDFVDNEIKSEFVFNNPNAKGHCGCGESFHV